MLRKKEKKKPREISAYMRRLQVQIVDTKTREGHAELERLLGMRRGAPDFATLREALAIVDDVLKHGLPALKRYVKRFDLAKPYSPSKQSLLVPLSGPVPHVSSAFVKAFRLAARRIEAYHRRQIPVSFSFKDSLGVSFVEKPFPHSAVGVYVPGGRAFYPSSLMMGVIPAKVAGVPRVVVATPPRAWKESPELRWAARELGVDEVLLAGGAHGIAGLVSVARCTKIVGPGNRWVAAAKHLVSSVVSVDLPAGPSEVLIVASGDADPKRVAADLLAQAEHDPDAVCLLFTNSKRLARAVQFEVVEQLEESEEGRERFASKGREKNQPNRQREPAVCPVTPARAVVSGSEFARVGTGNTAGDRPAPTVAARSLRRRGGIFLFAEISSAVSSGARVAAEHVQVMGKAAEAHAGELLATAGALFIGADTPTAFGDYIVGPNHVLPTGGAAASFSGLSVRDFYRWGRSVRVGPRAVARLAAPAATLARFEGLEAHARSLDLRRAR